MLHEAIIAGLTIDSSSNTPILILKTLDTNQSIPIWIGLLEATSIASALQKIDFDRPMTHDLFKNFMDVIKIRVSKIEVCDLKDNTFYARIYFVSEDSTFSMDSRPSDAIAIAIRFQASIYVDEKVIEKFKKDDDNYEVVDTSDEGKKWADYLDKLSPEDFGKYKV